MSTNDRILKWSLFVGALYFFSISVVHMLGLKVPFLFIYFNVPSNVYQDRIISFLAFGWAMFLFTAFTNPQKQSALVRAILVAGVGALLGLCINNLFTNFQGLGAGINVNILWLETAGVFAYWLWLVIFYFRSVK